MRTRLWLWLVLVAGASATSSPILIGQDAQVTPAVADPPVTFAEGARGALDPGLTGTSASVTYSALSLTRANITHVVGSDQSWSVRMELQSATGVGALDSYSVSLCRSTCTSQVVIATGSTTQTTGAPVDLPAGANDMYVGLTDTKLSFSDTVLDMQMVLIPTSEGGPNLRYDYVLTIT